jgi:streptogramin lyase
VLRGIGDAPLLVHTSRARREGDFAATVRFPTSGPWRLDVLVGGRRFGLGTVAVDVPVTDLIRDPFTIAALPDGSLLIGQRNGPLLRADEGLRVRVFAPIENVSSVAWDPSGVVLVTDATRLHRLRLDGTELSQPVSLGAEAAVAGDGAGNIFAALYANSVVRVDANGGVAPFAGTGQPGYSGDGGPAASALLFHPHDVAIRADGDVFIADTENSRIRRVDHRTGSISTFSDSVDLPIALAFGGNGALYSVGVRRGTQQAAVWETTSSGSTVIAQSHANDVAIGHDGTVYLNQWEEKRISRIDRRTNLVRTILRGR